MKRLPSFAGIVIAILLAGVFPAATNWLWARVMLLLWGLMLASELLAFLPAVRRIRPVVLVFTIAASLWSLALVALPSAPVWALAPIWMGLIVWAIRVRNDDDAPPDWLPFQHMLRLTAAILVIAVAGHWQLNRLHNAPFEWTWWTSATWAACAWIAAYPKQVWNPLRVWREPDWRWSTPLFVVILAATLGAQAAQYRVLANFVAETNRPDQGAERAFRAGYLSLGVHASALEAQRLLTRGELPEAVRYIRQQWRRADRTLFLRRFEQGRDGVLNPFFMLICFGGQFRLTGAEHAVDFDLDLDGQSLWLLTSEGRIIRIHARGWDERRWEIDTPRALSISPQTNQIAVLDREYILLGGYDATPIYLPFPQGNDYVDLIFSEEGDFVWTLEKRGQIDHYALQEDGGWIFNGNLMLPMWKEPIAQALLRSPENDGFIVMDHFGGADLRTSSLEYRHLSPFRNLQRPEARATSIDPLRHHLLLMDRHGRIDFADLAHEPTEEQRTAEARPPIAADLDFDRRRGAWFWHERAVALRMIPETDSILLLHESGFFQVIALPSGARLHYRRRPFVVNP